MSDSPVIELATLSSAQELNRARENLLEILRAGEVIIAPLENAYVFMCDAFNQTAVQKIHDMRGDAPGTACQVLIGSIQTLGGITTHISNEMQKLLDNFWPGLLTAIVQPSAALSWDLGDGGTLEKFAVRIPDHDFTRSLIKDFGPVAISNAAIAGAAPSRTLEQTAALPSEIGKYVDAGELPTGPATTVIAPTPAGGVECTREGAISLSQLREVLPQIGSADY